MIGGGLAAAGRFLARAWRGAWAALLLVSVAIALALASRSVFLWTVALIVILVARGGLWRLASHNGRPGPGGLQLGAVELRLAMVWGLTGLFLAIIGLLAFVVLLAGAYAAASAGPGFDATRISTWAPAVTGGGRILLSAIAVACGVGFAMAAVRISLAEAATVERGRVQVLSSFVLTRGRTLPLASAYLILVAPALVIAALGCSGGHKVAWAALEGGAIGGLWLPMSVGLMDYAVRSGATRK